MSDAHDQRAYFNALADSWDDRVDHRTERLSALLSALPIAPGARVLDVGTGTGVMIPWLHGAVGTRGEVVALDVADRMLAVAQRKHAAANVRFVCGDALDPALELGHLDGIVCYSVFPHFADQRSALASLAVRLRDGGFLAVAHGQSRNAINAMHAGADEEVRRDRLPPAQDIADWMSEAGLVPRIVFDDAEKFLILGVRQVIGECPVSVP